MFCKIADLYVNVPEAGGMAPRCQDYLWDQVPDSEVITIKEEEYQVECWSDLSYEHMCYLESGLHFYERIILRNGLMLHASAVEWQGRAYLFSASCGTGKSTHTRQWQKLYGDNNTVIFNDDKPALRFVDGKWYAYGTPWCGKDGINVNKKVPLAGICFLKQATENRIRRLNTFEGLSLLMDQTFNQNLKKEKAEALLQNLDNLFTRIPVFLLECTPTVDAAKLSSETMSRAADEAGL